MRVDPNGEGWICIAALIAIVALTFTGCSADSEAKKRAEEKYNDSTININGNNPDGVIDVTINDSGEKIQIENSYKISDPIEQKVILKTIVDSNSYKSDYKDTNVMRIEWSGHNFLYRITDNQFGNKVVSWILGREDAHSDAESVDIYGLDPNQGWYNLITLWGIIPW